MSGVDPLVRPPLEENFVEASKQGGLHESAVEISKPENHYVAEEIPSEGGGEDEAHESGYGSEKPKEGEEKGNREGESCGFLPKTQHKCELRRTTGKRKTTTKWSRTDIEAEAFSEHAEIRSLVGDAGSPFLELGGRQVLVPLRYRNLKWSDGNPRKGDPVISVYLMKPPDFTQSIPTSNGGG